MKVNRNYDYDELDELLEKAFCDGYEFAQREFVANMRLKSPDQVAKAANYLKDRLNTEQIASGERKPVKGMYEKLSRAIQDEYDVRNILEKNTTKSVKNHPDYKKYVKDFENYATTKTKKKGISGLFGGKKYENNTLADEAFRGLVHDKNKNKELSKKGDIYWRGEKRKFDKKWGLK